MYIENLLCRECNGGWARDLEEKAGEHLFDFLNHDAPMDRGLLGRWVRFFSIKCGAYYQRTEWLSGGERPLLRKLADPTSPDDVLYMTDLSDQPNVTWAYYHGVPFGSKWRGSMVITQSVVWLLPLSDSPPSGLLVTQPRDGMRRSELVKNSAESVNDAVVAGEAQEDVIRMRRAVPRDGLSGMKEGDR